MPEVVGRELRLPPGPDPGFGAGHHGGVVDQQVDLSAGREEAGRELPDAVEVSEVKGADLDRPRQLGKYLLGVLAAPRRYDDLRAGPGERPDRSRPASTSAAVERAPKPLPRRR
jgi:hypothetical protein